MILTRNATFIRFLTHFTTSRYFWSNWAYQWNSPAVQDSRGMALTVSMVRRVSVFSWLYFYKAQSGQKRENERRSQLRICWHVVNTRPAWSVCLALRTVLIEGEPGLRKTTYCKKYAYDWATKQAPQGCGSTAFKAVLLRKYREMHSDVWGAIDEQLLPWDIDEEVKQQYRFIDIGWIGWVTIQ